MLCFCEHQDSGTAESVNVTSKRPFTTAAFSSLGEEGGGSPNNRMTAGGGGVILSCKMVREGERELSNLSPVLPSSAEMQPAKLALH